MSIVRTNILAAGWAEQDIAREGTFASDRYPKETRPSATTQKS